MRESPIRYPDRTKTLMIGIPIKDTSTGEFDDSLDRLRFMGPPVGSSVVVTRAKRKHYIEARNLIWEEAKKSNVDWLLFLDNDVLMPTFSLRAFAEHKNLDVITGIYWTKDPTIALPIIFKERGGMSITEWKPCSLFEIGWAGLGCTFISKKVLNELTPPIFDWNYIHVEGAKYGKKKYDKYFKNKAGEDGYLFHRIREAGFKIWCDSRILCKHIDAKSGRTFPSDEEIKKRYGGYWNLASNWDFSPTMAQALPSITPKKTPKSESKLPVIRGKKINLGCGNDYRKGWINIDHPDINVKKDKEIDLETDEFPFRENSINYALFKDSLEHIRDITGLMNRLYRVMKPESKVEIIVPHCGHDFAYGDPGHVRYFNNQSFLYYDRQTRADNKRRGTPMSPYNLDCDFVTESIEMIIDPKFYNYDDQEIEFMVRHYRNIVKKMRVILKTRKEKQDEGKS